jgi:hypothetical protein
MIMSFNTGLLLIAAALIVLSAVSAYFNLPSVRAREVKGSYRWLCEERGKLNSLRLSIEGQKGYGPDNARFEIEQGLSELVRAERALYRDDVVNCRMSIRQSSNHLDRATHCIIVGKQLAGMRPKS